MEHTVDELRAILLAYQQVVTATWPELHPDMARRSTTWAGAGAQTLQQELDSYVKASSHPPSRVRLFWKMLPGFRFGGCNELFAGDAGMPALDLVGITDFDQRLPWVRQAGKYRVDDEAVVASGTSRLNIIERQRGTSGDITWVRVGKAPLRAPAGVIGVLGMYELLEPAEGQRLFAEQKRGGT